MSRRILAGMAFLGLAVGVFLPPPPLAAQSNKAGKDEQTLKEVVVTSTVGQFDNKPFTEKQKATATNNQVFDAVQLENSSATNLSDFLAEMGVMVQKQPNDYAHPLLSIRGFRTDHLSKELDGHVLFLIDGHRTGTNSATQIALNNIERVEILRGPDMLQYSAAAAGGIINVVTKKGGPDKLAAQVELGIGSFDYSREKVNLNGLVDAFDYSLGYQHTLSGDYSDGDGNTVYHTGNDGTNAVNLNMGYTFNERHRIGLSTYVYKVDAAERPAYFDQVDQIAYSDSFTDRIITSNTLSYDGATEDNVWSWKASYSFGKAQWEQFTGAINPVAPMSAKFDRDIFQTSLTYNDDLFTVTGGFDYLNYDCFEGGSGGVSFYPNGASFPNNGVSFTSGFKGTNGHPMAKTGEFRNIAGWLLADLKLLDDALIFTGGLRYDHYEISDGRVDPDDYRTGPGTPANSNYNPLVYGKSQWPSSITYNHLSPSFGVSYLPIEWLKLRANYTNSFRPPSPRESISGWWEPYNYKGYPWNKAEKTNTYETGFDVNLKDLNFSTTYFWSKTKDYVYQHADPVQDHARVRNADKQVRTGIELQLSGNVAGAMGYDSFELRPYFNYTHIFNSKELYREGYVDTPSTYYGKWVDKFESRFPKTSMAYGLRFRYPEAKLSANLNFSYFGQVPYEYYPVNTIEQSMNVPEVGYRSESFTVADFSLRKGLWDFGDKGNLELKLDVNNIFDKQYVVPGTNANLMKTTETAPTTYYMPGRSFYAGLVYNF